MGLNLTFKTVKGNVFNLEFPPDSKVEEIKHKIEETQGPSLPAADLVVISQGKILADTTSLADNNITENGFLVVMVKSKGKEKKYDNSGPAVEALQMPQAQVPAAASLESELSAAGLVTESQMGGSSELLVGGELDNRIEQIVEMGFPRDQVVAAMRAAFNNSERAIEYLMSGIPEASGIGMAEAPEPASAPAVAHVAPQVQPGSSPPSGPNAQPLDMFASQGAGTAAASPSLGSGPFGALEFLRNSPQFQTLRQIVQTQPNILQPMLQELGRQNPGLLSVINNNQEEFLRLLNEPGASGGITQMAADLASQFATSNDAEPGARIRLTPEDQTAIERLQQLGFDRMQCVEAYFACDRNEEMAANYLFDSINDA
eukprot:jgi/Botrbrau1/20193/Bobra.0547s0001.5